MATILFSYILLSSTHGYLIHILCYMIVSVSLIPRLPPIHVKFLPTQSPKHVYIELSWSSYVSVSCTVNVEIIVG